ncbi:MAG: ChaN family lipoprotein [Cytophagaceae bacterium]|nr:ChaN family lipoprotein [Cytophagaceae bacterium]
MRRFALLFPCFFIGLALKSDKPAYLVYDQQLKPSRYEEVLRQAANADVVLFGELHNNPICHWLELQLTKDLFAEKKNDLVIGAEMFETDNQPAYSDYLAKRLTDKQLSTEARLWPNFATDYKPILDFARTHGLPVVATNIPRRYASLVARQGLAALDSLPADTKRFVAPLPFPVDLSLPGYKKMLDMGGMHGGNGMPGMSAENMAQAQATKDATMAHFILQNWSKGKVFLHLNGSYHSQNFEGIVWYLKKQKPNLNVVTITSTEEADIARPTEAKAGAATFTVCIPADMTKTY